MAPRLAHREAKSRHCDVSEELAPHTEAHRDIRDPQRMIGIPL
jgi:hypothetical protein